MKFVILDAGTLGDFDLVGLPPETQVFQDTSESQVLERCLNAEVIITNKVKFTSDILERLPKLKAFVILATGVDNLDLRACKERNIKVLNAKGYSTDSVISLTFSMVFYFLIDLPYYQNFTQNRSWIEHNFFSHYKNFHQLSSRVWTIIGLGTIGEKVARIASSFGCQVQYVSTSGKNHRDDFIQVSLDEAMSSSDIITIHAPLNEQTENLIRKSHLESLKEDCIFLNLGRGGIINEDDLANFLDKDTNIKIGLDVLSSEPMKKDSPLVRHLNHKNFLITPHVAWASKESRENLWKMTLENINKVLEDN